MLSRSNSPILDEDDRAAKLAEVLALYDDYGRGMDGMQLPYVSRCFRATVVEAAWAPRLDEEPSASATTRTTADGDDDADVLPIDAAVDPVVQDGSDSDLLLIDFR